MSNKETWDEVLTHLRAMDPKVKSVPCEDETSADKTLVFVPIDSICFFTTDFDKEKKLGYDVMVVTDAGHRYFMKYGLGELEADLADNPRFLRSGEYYVINLTKVRGSRINRARDLKFEGSEGWTKNAVSFDGKVTKYLTRFTERFIGNV